MDNGELKSNNESKTMSCNWIGTYYAGNNENGESPEELQQLFDSILQSISWKYTAFQVEQCPITNRLHIQFYIMFIKNVRFNRVKSWFPGAHIERRHGTHDQARDYCTKDDTRVLGPWIIGDEPSPGKRTDMDSLKSSIDDGKSTKVLWQSHFPLMVRYHRAVAVYQCTRLPARNWNTHTIVHYGDTGTGKTYRVFNNHDIETIFVLSKPPCKSATIWFDGYDPIEHKVVLIDEFYGWLSFNFVMRLIDRYAMQVQTKGGFLPFLANYVYFTSNVGWESWYKFDQFINPDRAKRSFRRRLDEIHHFDEPFIHHEN